MPNTGPQRVNIRPGVTILSVLQHLNYQPWYAMAEFVDNALQSFLDYREALERVEGKGFKLQVTIEIDPVDGGRITIRDNAAGIHEADYTRAFRPAEVPLTRSGLSEFGMGMKSAACWFARNWTVRTSALGEPVERLVSFDIQKIIRDSLEDLSVTTTSAPAERHFTEISLENLNRAPHGRTIGKIKDHLASIYRIFLREGSLQLVFDDDPLTYPDPDILYAPFYKDEAGPSVSWRKDIDFDFGLGLRATGFAALRETASTTRAGFALFRRKRLIQGSADEGYRPEFIFGRSNSYRYQRLFGELHLDGFEVSHTKDGFRWDENEEVFLQYLREELNRPPLQLLDQAEGHRVRKKSDEIRRAATEAIQATADVIEREVPRVLEGQLNTVPSNAPPPETLPPTPTLARRTIDVNLLGHHWQLELELSNDPAVSDWVSLSDRKPPVDAAKGGDGIRHLSVRMALAHPFTERFAGSDAEQLEPLLRIAAAIMLAETAARESGARQTGELRRNINQLLREALSKP
jgi:hypothetical protein